MSLGNFCSRLLTVFVFLAIVVFQVSLAQGSGTIKGQVLDQMTGESLVGANVTVENTSIGNAADLDGYYTLRLVPAGKWTLKVSYVGYKSITQEVTVADNAIIEQNFRLAPQAIAGEEVVVTAQARGQVQAINQQLSADKISSVVSEARIQELPDFNAAAAISRLPGITTLSSSGEANKVVIRGMAPKFNQITIGGISLASTGSTQIGVTSQGGTAGSISNDRSVDLSMMSPYMIKTISVYKSLTPDMNANAIGGTVNMELREAPSEIHADLLLQTGYTKKSDHYGNYRAVVSASGRFFDDKLGIYALGNIEQYDRDADNMSAGYEITSDKLGDNGYLPVRVTNVQLNRHYETRKRFGGNLVFDYRLASGSIKFINMFSRLNSDYRDYRTILNYSSQSQDLAFRYQEGNNDVDLAINSLSFTYDLGFMSIDLKAANNYSRNNLPSAPQSDFSQTRGVGTSTPNTIPEDLTSLITYGGTAGTYLNTLTRFSSDYKENGQTAKGDFKFPISLSSDLSGYVKVGTEYKYIQHKNGQETPYASIIGTTTIQTAISNAIRAAYPDIIFDAGQSRFPATSFTSSDTKITEPFLDDRFGGIIWANEASILNNLINVISSDPQYSADNAPASQPGGWFYGYYQTLPNRYKYIERYLSGYFMSELNYNDLMVVGGVRYEKQRGIYDAYILMDGRDTRSQRYFPVTAFPENEFWLPMIQAKYKMTEWFDIRAAFAQTLARPDYHQLAPNYTIGYGQGSVRAGNPNLRTAQADNYDLVLTFNSNELGLLTIGGFYKEITDFTYATQYSLYETAPEGVFTISDFNIGGTQPVRGANLFTYMNSPYTAYIRGLEVDLQARFLYMPAPLNGVILGVNYTRMSSEATYPWRNARTTIIGPRQTLTEVFDSTRTGRLINQPNDIVNAYIGYDYKDFSARLSFLFQGNSVSYVGNFAEQDGFTRDYFRIDASVRQVLPWYGIELYLDVTNLNNETNSSAQQSIGGFTSEQNYGLTANLGIRYRFSNL
ncbi:MAG: TonB-dependent receptor [Bacteroidetes bacterium]|nr:TonB-dependent receptor [Bacteroidota bacterium]